MHHPLSHLLLARSHYCQVQLTADLVISLPYGNIMASFRSCHCSHHSSRACADNQNLFGLPGRHIREFILPAKPWVNMAMALRRCLGTADAASAAACARSDLVKLTFYCLLAKIRICQKRTSHSHAVYQAALYDLCRIADIVDLAYCIYRNAHYFLDLRSFIYIDAPALILARNDMFQAFILGSAGYFQHAYASSLELRRQVEHIFKAVASYHSLVSGDTKENREIKAHIPAGLLNHLDHKTGTVVKASAIFIHALVSKW